MNKFHLPSFFYTCIFTLFSTSINASLIGVLPATSGSNDYQAYYDDVANLTWLANANLSGVAMIWDDANLWAAGLNISGVTGWRLPDTPDPDVTCDTGTGSLFGELINCTGSEIGNLFYNVLGGVAGQSITTTHNANFELFSDIQSDIYWSATPAVLSSPGAWDFDFNQGIQNASPISLQQLAWAVKSGNASAVPVPAAAWFFGSGLIGLIGIALRSKT